MTGGKFTKSEQNDSGETVRRQLDRGGKASNVPPALDCLARFHPALRAGLNSLPAYGMH
jgi:hypothetical protein